MHEGKSTNEAMLWVVQKWRSSRSSIVKFAGRATGDIEYDGSDAVVGLGDASMEATVGGPLLRGWV
jgi:hypothetical protein